MFNSGQVWKLVYNGYRNVYKTPQFKWNAAVKKKMVVFFKLAFTQSSISDSIETNIQMTCCGEIY